MQNVNTQARIIPRGDKGQNIVLWLGSTYHGFFYMRLSHSKKS